MEKDIFDITDLSDTPYKWSKKNTIRSKIVELVNLSNYPVSPKQATAAYFRKYKEDYGLQRMSSQLHTANRLGLINKDSRGLYFKLEK